MAQVAVTGLTDIQQWIPEPNQRGTGRHYYVSRGADILGLDDQELGSALLVASSGKLRHRIWQLLSWATTTPPRSESTHVAQAEAEEVVHHTAGLMVSGGKQWRGIAGRSSSNKHTPGRVPRAFLNSSQHPMQ
jgi:hypothetical protein